MKTDLDLKFIKGLMMEQILKQHRVDYQKYQRNSGDDGMI